MSENLDRIGNELGRTSNVSLAAAAANPYSRTFAGSGYRRASPLQVALGAADVAAPVSLAGWEGYDQDSVPPGSNLAIAMGYAGFNLTWTNPAGYGLAPSILDCFIYVRSMGAAQDLSVNPFVSPDKTQSGGDGESAFVTAASFVGEFVAIGILTRFDDSVVVHEGAVGFSPAGGQTPLLAAIGISSGQAIWAPEPSIDDVIQLTDPGTCIAGCTGCVDVRLNVTMQGTSSGRLERRVDGGAFALVDAAVPAGSSQLNQFGLDAQKHYEWRLRYNAVSPDAWSTIEGITTECTLT